ncbi:hypothetical protein ACJMK2_041294 [Sinanodonta woodiana]|uniref:TRIM56 n=1 Tax=Sinanodonta woodiana TaxID=1069815 RepID=A0ABD3W6L1_SINWO
MATASRIQSNCGICLQPYKRPKILPCFHSYCEACLASHISKANPDSKFQCPLCRADIDIPDSGASFFQTNFYIDTTEEEGNDSEEVSCLCENCDGGTKPKAAYYCEVCEQKICEECAQLHKKLKITRDHDLTSLTTVRTKKFDQEKCFEHESEFVDRYCITCEEFLCSSCDSDVHDQHSIELIAAAANLKRNRLNKELIACEKFCANEKILKIISQRESAVEEMERKAKDHLHQRAAEIKMDIDVNVKKIENEIMKICEDKKDKLKQLNKDVESTQEKTVPLKKWITSASDTEVLREGGRILCKFKEVNASSQKSIPEIPLVKFERNCHQIDSKSIGLVVTDKETLFTTEIEIVSAFCTPQFNEIKCIMQCQGGKVWIAETGTKGLTLFNEWGSENKNILEQFEIASVAVSNDGILFISVPAEKLIYKITENTKATQHFSLTSIPGDIAVFDNGNMAICCNEPAKLLIIDHSGQVVRQYAPRGSKFKAVHCVAVCKFTDILAVCAQDIVDSGTATGCLSMDVKQPKLPTPAFVAPSSGSLFGQVEMKQSSGSTFNFGSPSLSVFKTRDENKTPQNSPKNTEVKGNIFLFDQKGNMMTKIKRQVHDLIFDSQGHLLVSLDEGNIDVLDYRGNILACLRPNGSDFLSGKMALDSLNRLWIGKSGRINVFIYPDVILYIKDEDQ